MAQRAVVFIDGSNIFWGCKGFRDNFKIDYKKLVDEIVGNRELIRPYFYCGIGVPPNPDEIRFHVSLKFQGFNVVSRPIKVRQGRAVEKGVDVALVTDLLKLAFMNVYDAAILVSGDDDFAEAVKVIKDRGIRVEIAAFEHTIGRELRMLADKFISIDSIAEKIEKRYGVDYVRKEIYERHAFCSYCKNKLRITIEEVDRRIGETEYIRQFNCPYCRKGIELRMYEYYNKQGLFQRQVELRKPKEAEDSEIKKRERIIQIFRQ